MVKPKITPWRKTTYIIWGVVIALAALGYVVYDTWMIHQKTQAMLYAPGVISENDKAHASEGVETTKVSEDALSKYKVAATAPRILKIDAIGITARIRPMGLNSDRSIQAPRNINDSGWYTGSAKPGEAGVVFIDGHASGVSRQGLFADLDTLKRDDIVKIEKGNGATVRYKVVHIETIPLNEINMNKILSPYPGIEKGLNLMTCTGKWVKESATLDHRVVVYTEQV